MTCHTMNYEKQYTNISKVYVYTMNQRCMYYELAHYAPWTRKIYTVNYPCSESSNMNKPMCAITKFEYCEVYTRQETAPVHKC